MTSKKRKRARAHRAGQLVAALFAGLAVVVGLLTLVVFQIDAESAVAVVVLESALATLTARNLYFGVSRLLVPSWAVERWSYSSSGVIIDGDWHHVTKPSHTVSGTWSRPFSVFVLVLWPVLWAALAGAFLFAGYNQGLRFG